MKRPNFIKQRTVSADLRPDEYRAIHQIAFQNNVFLSQYLRAMIIDVIYEESNVARPERSRSEISPGSGERGEASRKAAA